MMFVPQPVKAQDWLKDRKDPPIAVQWWPAESYVSCDGTAAVNTGPWVRPKGVGLFHDRVGASARRALEMGL